jgi:tetratricopeptide (TPR) repeat protein
VLAHHFYEAGLGVDPIKTVSYLKLAGEQAAAASAYEEALRHFERARDLLAPSDRAGRAEVLRLEGCALRGVGRYDEAEAVWSEAIALHEELGERRAAGDLCLDLSWLHSLRGRVEEAVEITRRAADLFGAEHVERRALTLGDATAWAANAGRVREAERLYQETKLAVEATGSPQAAVALTTVRFDFLYCCYRLGEALEIAGAAVEASRDRGPWFHANWYCEWMNSLNLGGHFAEALDCARAGYPLNEKVGNRVVLPVIDAVRRSAQWAIDGDLDEIWSRVLEDIERAGGDPESWGSVLLFLSAVLRLWRGEWERAADDARSFGERLPAGHYDHLDAALEMNVLALLGRREEVASVLDAHRHGLPVVGELNPAGAWELAIGATEACVLVGLDDESAALYRTLRQLKDQGVVASFLNYSLVETALGISAAAGGSYAEADEHFAEAVRQADELPLQSERAKARQWHAWALLRRAGAGDRDRAHALLGEAIARYQAMKIVRHAELARSMMR